jgi:CopG-like RHH_1 or ribbon-helix-helix domain, RHH_5
MSQRLQIVLPDPVAAQLHELADASGEPVATLAARIVRDGVAHPVKDGKLTAPAAPRRTAATMDQRPPWLEPYGGDSVWWREMWGSVVALHGRYPRQLEHLKDGWWDDEATAETVCALAVWRAEIDQHGRDPREELAFHHQLADIADTLRQQGGGVESRWTPGAPPERWDG